MLYCEVVMIAPDDAVIKLIARVIPRVPMLLYTDLLHLVAKRFINLAHHEIEEMTAPQDPKELPVAVPSKKCKLKSASLLSAKTTSYVYLN